MELNENGHAESSKTVAQAQVQANKDMKAGKIVAQKKEGDPQATVVTKPEQQIDAKTTQITSTTIPTKG